FKGGEPVQVPGLESLDQWPLRHDHDRIAPERPVGAIGLLPGGRVAIEEGVGNVLAAHPGSRPDRDDRQDQRYGSDRPRPSGGGCGKAAEEPAGSRAAGEPGHQSIASGPTTSACRNWWT